MPQTNICQTQDTPPPSPVQPSHFNWMQAAWMGALAHMTATMLGEYNDSLMLGNAAQLEQQLGAASVQFTVNESSLSGFNFSTESNPAYTTFLNTFLSAQTNGQSNLEGIVAYGIAHYGWPQQVEVPVPPFNNLRQMSFEVYASNLLSQMSSGLLSPAQVISDIKQNIPTSFSEVVEAYAHANNLSAPPVTITVVQENGNTLTGNYTLGQLLQIQGYYANQGGKNGTADANVMQSLIGQLQAQLSQRIQIGQQYVTQETNLATSTDPQSSNQASSEVSAINTSKGQWVQLTGTLAG